ncbi:hypothetical protein SAMN05216327_101184 [Dyadobacter sp. SG02]|uniref:hypothetical protein n=1 Tax=Dyadobacter sp. SG02 TaxID=1855291 RepID=UPI0008BD1E96|nr:hypothetical protein [Dyadobacter sp. SG02]SEI39315.1 hypothetical protein SAMN05216327_101184 [Dyadobacter sp. SG02]
MENLMIHLSNGMNALFLVGILVASLFRLTDGAREYFVERISLVLIMIGAFFMLLKAARPSGTSFEVLFLNSGLFMWICTQTYSRYLNQWNRWISK